MKRGLVFSIFAIILFIFFILFISAASASVLLGNKTFEIDTNYAQNSSLRGWINISIQNEQADLLLTAFNSKITLLDFLLNNALSIGDDFACIPSDCLSGYLSLNQETSKIFSLDAGKSKTIGFKITENNFDSISAFSLKFSSDAGESSYPQLRIDILDDNSTDWNSYNSSGNFDSEVYGCLDTMLAQAEITQNPYCEKIKIRASPNVKIGADIIAIPGKGENVDFIFNIYNNNYEGSCTATATGSGKISCIPSNFKIDSQQDFFVCINAKNSQDNNKYAINYEQNQSCGFTGEFSGSYTHDFSIFARAGKYAPIGSFILNNNELSKSGSSGSIEDMMSSYISDKYNNNCTSGCVIPIKLSSMKSQNIVISDASLSYNAGISKTINNIYDLNKTASKINMNFQKLNLDNSNLIVPSAYGNQSLILRLGNAEIINKKINIARVPVIDFVAPLNLPSFVSVLFIAFASGGNISKYKWDFGDGSEIVETSENHTHHTYSSMGTFNLKLSVTNENGESTKEFIVKVTSPKDVLNSTLKKDRENINSIRQKLETYPAWYKKELLKKSGIDDLDSELKAYERKFEIAYSDEEYVSIISNLSALNIPNKIGKSNQGTIPFVVNPEDIDLDALDKIGAGSYNSEEADKYKEAIAIWASNVNINLDFFTLSYYYDNKIVPVVNYFKITLSPSESKEIENYFVINKEAIINSEDAREIGDDIEITGVRFDSLEEREIELVIFEDVDVTMLPAYISPEFNKLELSAELSPCNNNGKCEEGETWKNCRKDCRPIGLIILYICILVFVAFVSYIVLQEWYKRKYESHLFKNRNDLFNLANFISNAQAKGLDKKEVGKRLKQYGWSSEQIDYAFKKVKGKKTGMPLEIKIPKIKLPGKKE